MRRLVWPVLGCGAALLWSSAAAAHGFGRLYTLPVPFWLYGWAAVAVLVLSFVVAAVWMRPMRKGPSARALPHLEALLRLLAPVLRALGLGCLLLCIVTGFWGNRDPYKNLNMTLFWVWVAVAGVYLTALLGDAFAVLNPWRTAVRLLGRVWPSFPEGRWRYPQGFGQWPALVLWLAWISVELFCHNTPRLLAGLLSAYSLLTLLAVAVWGAKDWFAHGECFSVAFGLWGRLAPIAYCPQAQRGAQLQWRGWCRGMVDNPPTHRSQVVMALALLSSTAFDGLRATQAWVWMFWRDPFGLLRAAFGDHPLRVFATVRPWYLAWECFWLWAAPWIYLALYGVALAAARRMAGPSSTARDWRYALGYSLLPIALVYHATHYLGLWLSQGPKIVSLLSDPFGWGWNLWGTARLWRAPILPDVAHVWHAQVALILLGHVWSVWVGHRVALSSCHSVSAAWRSQLPMLVLMVIYTVVGLWILAQPLTAELMR